MDLQQIMNQAHDTLTVKRVFGDPYEKNGVTVIPVARVMGGGGGGEGTAPAPVSGESGEEAVAPVSSGSGGGFGASAQPAGVYVVKGDEVRWVPAVDVNRIVLGAQAVAIIFLLVIRSIARSRAKAASS